MNEETPEEGETWVSETGIDVIITGVSYGFVKYLMFGVHGILSISTFVSNYRKRPVQFEFSFE